jgi:hypothetical protein
VAFAALAEALLATLASILLAPAFELWSLTDRRLCQMIF